MGLCAPSSLSLANFPEDVDCGLEPIDVVWTVFKPSPKTVPCIVHLTSAIWKLCASPVQVYYRWFFLYLYSRSCCDLFENCLVPLCIFNALLIVYGYF